MHRAMKNRLYTVKRNAVIVNERFDKWSGQTSIHKEKYKEANLLLLAPHKNSGCLS